MNTHEIFASIKVLKVVSLFSFLSTNIVYYSYVWKLRLFVCDYVDYCIDLFLICFYAYLSETAKLTLSWNIH